MKAIVADTVAAMRWIAADLRPALLDDSDPSPPSTTSCTSGRDGSGRASRAEMTDCA
jgi:hypothetical protein